MTKAVLISIQPQWCEKEVNGEKTLEVRKTKPKLQTPFKCYIYCTKGKSPTKFVNDIYIGDYIANGKVIGEFMCDKIYELAPLNHAPENVETLSCLSREEIVSYLHGKGYAWHISELVIYDKPKQLSEFKQCHKCEYCKNCMGHELSCNGAYNLTRPPQSWCYVQED